MIILDSRNPWFTLTRPLAPFRSACVLIVPENADLPADMDQKFDQPPTVFEWTSPMASALDSLRTVVATLWIRPGPKATRLIFLGPTAPPDLLTPQTAAADLHWALTPDGDLSHLTCGHDTVANGLFATFFLNMGAGITAVHTPVSMALFAQHIGKNQAGQADA